MDSSPSTSSSSNESQSRPQENETTNEIPQEFTGNIHKNIELENIILDAIEFLSHAENRTPQSIEHFFIPKLMGISHTFNNGKTMDITLFNHRSTREQRRFLAEIFRNVTTVMFKTPFIGEDAVFVFLRYFQKATELKINVYGDDIYKQIDLRLKYQSIKIVSIKSFPWLDPIFQLLEKNLNIIHRLSLYNGILSEDTIRKISQNEICKLTLADVELESEEDRDLLTSYILSNKQIKKTKDC